MKFSRIQFACFIIATSLLLLAGNVTAQLSPVVVKVNVTGSTDIERAKPPKKGGIIPKVKVTQERQLEITLANHKRSDFDGLVVQYFLFAKGVEDREISLLRTGKRVVTVHGLQSETVKTELVTTTHTEQYSKKSQGQVVFVPPSGKKFAGYGVQVWDGDKLLTQVFDPPELKAHAATAWMQDDDDSPRKSRRRSD